MSQGPSHKPSVEGQLVWCPSDPSLGIGVVTGAEPGRVKVRFLRLQEDRHYTTRGESVLARYALRAGERVRDDRGREHKVKDVADIDPKGLITYELDSGEIMVESKLIPEVRDVGARERLATLNLAHPEVVRARLQGLNLAELGSRPGVAAVLGARVEWLPHQIDVATRAIERDPVRLLLADEVGLGKTVEAALIYAGLRYEERADRVLILTPDSLCIQWLGEIFRKAHELLVLLDDERLEDAGVDFPDMSPFEAYQRIVTSVDRLAKDDELARLACDSEWDLVIVDEAHHLRWRPEDGGNAAYKLVEVLAQRSRHLLLLTATPMALDPAEYHALLRLLDRGRFDDPRAFADIGKNLGKIRDTARALVQARDSGEPVAKAAAADLRELLADDPDDLAEAETFLGKPAAAEAADRRRDVDPMLEHLRARHGLTDYVVRNRRGPVGGLPERKPQVFPLEATEMQQKLIDVGESVMMELADTIDEPRERQITLGRLFRALWATPRALADIVNPLSPKLAQELIPHVAKVVTAGVDKEGLPLGDARLRWLVRYLKRMDEGDKLLVFVETSIAVRALKDSLEGLLGGDVAVFHRGLPPRDQDRQVAWFRDPTGPRLMLCTEAGGEGRNFQFCNQVVLYDLPWRPATVEQRIGRIDRVGQDRDVRVLVPYFKTGYEAAVLKIMQESIGVLDKTVGGIDHALEYVEGRLADLILDQAGVDAWKGLYRETESLIKNTRARIEAEDDPILDHASFSRERVDRIMADVPADLETRTETFLHRYAEHSKLHLHQKGGLLWDVEGAPGAAGREDDATYVATFSRAHANDHEDVEFLSFGHPLLEQALEWAHGAEDAAASLAIGRGFATDGAIFLWSFELALPDDVPEAGSYFGKRNFTLAVDEGGKHVPMFDNLIDDPHRRLDRMDPAPLRESVGRWRRLVEQNFTAAETLANAFTRKATDSAKQRLEAALERRRRDLLRLHRRELLRLASAAPAEPKSKTAPKAKAVGKGKASKTAKPAKADKAAAKGGVAPESAAQLAQVQAAHLDAEAALDREAKRLRAAVDATAPRLIAAVAVRLMRNKDVSA